MKIKFGLLTIAGREKYYVDTLESLSKSGIEPERIDGTMIPIQSHFLAWKKLFREMPDYVVKFEDDIVTGLGLGDTIRQILKDVKPSFLTLYSNRAKIINHDPGVFEFHSNDFLHEQGVAMSWITYLQYVDWMENLRFMKPHKESNYNKCHDVILRSFFKEYNIKTFATSPSLIQHIGIESAHGHPWKIAGIPRQSRNFIGESTNIYKYYMEHMR